MVTYGNFSALLTGDAGYLVMESIAQDAGDIDILKIPHHGSKTGMSNSFLSQIKAELGIISVGSDNTYGHPAPISMDLLTKYKIKSMRTDISGDIEILSDGKTWSVRVKK